MDHEVVLADLDGCAQLDKDIKILCTLYAYIVNENLLKVSMWQLTWMTRMYCLNFLYTLKGTCWQIQGSAGTKNAMQLDPNFKEGLFHMSQVLP